MTVNSYYNSTKQYTPTTSGDTAKKWCASRYLTKAELPVGSVILVDSGYQYRPDGWVNSTTVNSSRPGLVTEPLVRVTEDWWGDYTVRGFNLGCADGSAMTAENLSHLRVYVPIS